MTAIAWGRTETDAGQQGAQPFDARRHLRDVAELISVVFAEDLDASGHGALEEMQWVSRLSPLLGGILSTTFFSEFVLGYVWVEAGRVVGNVTFQRHDLTGTRWRISNVAVAPAFRRRGIARALMQATIADIALRDGHWAILQVRADNPSARRLYEDLGFKEVCLDGVWELPSTPAADGRGQRRGTQRGPARCAGAVGFVSTGATASSWPVRPVRRWRNGLTRLTTATISRGRQGPGRGPRPAVRPARVPALGRPRARAWSALSRCCRAVAMARISCASRPRPTQSALWESALLARGLSLLAALPPRPVVIEHAGDDADCVATLESLGFRPQRVLLTMRSSMTAADLGF